jgi:hypothetical protein
MAEQPQTRFHGKVRVQKGETMIEFNIFDDIKENVYLGIQQAVAQFSNDIKPATAAQREIARAEQARATQPALAPTPAPKPKANAQVCPQCGTAGKLELIYWDDKDTGEPRSAYKCQACKKWLK